MPSSTEHADVLEIGKHTSATAAKSQLDRLKQAYGIFFANSAQRSATRFGGLLQNGGSVPRNPIFGDDTSGLDYDYVEDFDQQGLAAQANPVYKAAPSSTSDKPSSATPPLPSPTSRATSAPAPQPSETVKVFTLYFSGRVPGEYTTRLTTVSVTPSASAPAAESQSRQQRRRREAIQPTRVQPIAMTEPPASIEYSPPSLDSSPCAASTVWLEGSKRTVTVTETVTVYGGTLN